MHGQGVLDLGDFDQSPGRDALVQGIRATLQRLERDGVLDDRHAGLIALLRAEAHDYVMAHGIARTNYAKLLGEHLTMLLEMEVPQEEGEDAGGRVTKLSEWLTARRLAADVRDAPSS